MIALALAAAIGAFDPSVSAAEVCRPRYAQAHRNVPRVLRERVYAVAGVPRGQRCGWVIDHIIPLELGGTNARANLAAQPRAEARTKDRDENRLHAAVCSGSLSLAASAVRDPPEMDTLTARRTAITARPDRWPPR